VLLVASFGVSPFGSSFGLTSCFGDDGVEGVDGVDEFVLVELPGPELLDDDSTLACDLPEFDEPDPLFEATTAVEPEPLLPLLDELADACSAGAGAAVFAGACSGA
jgi:hypothetical protein